MLVLEGQHADLPVMLTEFGGIALARQGSDIWGYSVAATPEEFATRYEGLLGVVRNLGLLAGFCYTQFADTYQEANGLLHGGPHSEDSGRPRGERHPRIAPFAGARRPAGAVRDPEEPWRLG